MTAEELKELGLPIKESDKLYVESALEWLYDNTTLAFALDDIESIKALPSGAKLFLVKFCEIGNRKIGVTSETVGPMSRNFSSAASDKLILNLARQFLKSYLKPNVTFIPCQRRWM